MPPARFVSGNWDDLEEQEQYGEAGADGVFVERIGPFYHYDVSGYTAQAHQRSSTC